MSLFERSLGSLTHLKPGDPVIPAPPDVLPPAPAANNAPPRKRVRLHPEGGDGGEGGPSNGSSVLSYVVAGSILIGIVALAFKLGKRGVTPKAISSLMTSIR